MNRLPFWNGTKKKKIASQQCLTQGASVRCCTHNDCCFKWSTSKYLTDEYNPLAIASTKMRDILHDTLHL